MASEEQLLGRIRRRLPSQAKGALRTGIGDDAAVIRCGGATEWVITTDAFIENVHFLPRVHPPRAVGYKAVARATSDLAAMGARPRFFFLTLALPDACTHKWLDDFLGGMLQAARKFGLILAGGDTTRYRHIVMSLTVLGEVHPGRAILRSGAQPGDLICVSGRLGEAELGLRLLRRGVHRRKRWKTFVAKHLRPEPRLALGQWLAKTRLASAMIDVSDGLSTDLAHVCKASGVGARVWSRKIPPPGVPGVQRLGLDPLQLALHGGDEYELLFTVRPRRARHIPRTFHGVPITVIGEITRDKRILLVDDAGRLARLKPQGWDPFSGSAWSVHRGRVSRRM